MNGVENESTDSWSQAIMRQTPIFVNPSSLEIWDQINGIQTRLSPINVILQETELRSQA